MEEHVVEGAAVGKTPNVAAAGCCSDQRQTMDVVQRASTGLLTGSQQVRLVSDLEYLCER